MTVQVDRYTRFLLTIIAVLLGVVALGLWCETAPMIPAAQAGIPDSGAQLDQLVQKVTAIEGEIRELKALLISGNVKVRIVESQGGPKPASQPQKTK